MRFLWRRTKRTYLIFGVVILVLCYMYFFTERKGTSFPVNDNPYNRAFLIELEISEATYQARLSRYLKYKATEGQRKGPGEMGVGVVLTAEEQKQADLIFKKEAFNKLSSDRISLQRGLRDMRMSECKRLKYPEDLPTASVIIIYHNEAWTALLRTAHSVVNRTPPRYLKEVILLDDSSYREELGKELEDYVAKTWPDGVVQIVHRKERQGLIRARLEGAKVATGDVVIFLDSHCEASEGWIEPLLARIAEDPNVALCPVVDSISDKDLSYVGYQSGVSSIGSFWWGMHFTWDSVPDHERRRRKSETDPVRSPTMPGGLFAMDRRTFFRLGSYDDGMEIWGGENLELSFRVWMCGGKLEFIPCSHVGHIFRAAHPYTFPGRKDYHGINSVRLAEVWLDEYKRLFYALRPDLLKVSYGDVSSRTALRRDLQCKNFQWFLDNVIPEKFIPDRNVSGYGTVRNPASNLCLDLLGQNEFDRGLLNTGVYPCQGGKSGPQMFSLTHAGQIRREWGCLTVGPAGDLVNFINCNSMATQKWLHNKKTGTIVSQSNHKCLDATGLVGSNTIRLQPCSGNSYQTWAFENYI